MQAGHRAASGCSSEREAVWTAARGLESHRPGSDPVKPQAEGKESELALGQQKQSGRRGPAWSPTSQGHAFSPRRTQVLLRRMTPGGPHKEAVPALPAGDGFAHPSRSQPVPRQKVEGRNWTQPGFPGAQAEAPEAGELGRGGGPGAGAAPEKRQQWLPWGAPGWGSPAQRRAQPSSPAPWLAWASAGRSGLAPVPGTRAQGRRRAGAGCRLRRRQSTARRQERELRLTSPESVKDSSDRWPGMIRSHLYTARGASTRLHSTGEETEARRGYLAGSRHQQPPCPPTLHCTRLSSRFHQDPTPRVLVPNAGCGCLLCLLSPARP